MRRLHIIGIGAGNPDHVTIQAIEAMKEVDVFFIPDKGVEKADLKRLRTTILERFVGEHAYRIVEVAVPKRGASPSYRADVDAWHAAIAARYETLVMAELADGECGGFLVWGDPALYDSTLRIIGALEDKGLPLEYDVIPGISSIQALAARHKIALNRIGESVAIMPGRRLAEGLPSGIDDIVVVLDGDRAYQHVLADDPDIFWGAYIGTEDECLVAGRLSEVMDRIEALREEKRSAKGWLMDTYLLRRRPRTA